MLSVNQKSLQGFSSIYFANEASPENQAFSFDALDRMIQKEILVEKSILIDRYFRSEIRERFNFKDNGFGFVSLDGKIVENLGTFANMSCSEDHSSLEELLREKLRLFLTDWGKAQGIEFDVVIAADDLTYRHTTTGFVHNYGPDSSLPANQVLTTAHVDFCEKDFSTVLTEYSYLLEDVLRNALQDDSIDMQDFELVEAVNLWMPLNERPALNTLSIMDVSTIQNPSEELKSHKLGGYHCLNTIHFRDYHKWVAQEDMERGDGVVFKSFKTPHGAVTFEKEIPSDNFRHSLEGRYFFLKRKKTI